MGQLHICGKRNKIYNRTVWWFQHKYLISYKKKHRNLPQSTKKNNLYEDSVFYELKCQNCPGRYIGQTGRKFKTRYKEHIQDIKNNKSKKGFAHHILNTGNSYNNIEKSLQILNIEDNVPYINTLEKFQKNKTKKTGILVNDNYADIYNPIYELLL
jgi:hypothetical protein